MESKSSPEMKRPEPPELRPQDKKPISPKTAKHLGKTAIRGDQKEK